MIEDIKSLQKGKIKSLIDKRLEEFSSFKQRPTEDWFCELCFCLLTANSKAETAIKLQQQLGFKGFCELPKQELAKAIRSVGHRFHNNKACYITLARDFVDIKWVILGLVHDGGSVEAREWLVDNIKGLGYKEASHFLRNVGFKDVAILDRHVLNLLVENAYLEEKPKTLNRKKYLEIEKLLANICQDLNMSQAELDMYLWYLKTGTVLK
jgi:N-glycosylase/DNA lyase